MTRDRTAATAAIVLGLGIALNAVLGPLMLGVIRIRESASMENQLLGGEVTSLLIAAPLAIAAGVAWWRGSSLAPVLALGPSGFAVYMYVQFILVPDYSRYDGNSEQWFPFYLALVVLGWSTAWRAWGELSARRVPPLHRPLGVALGVTLVVMNSFFALAWLGSIADVLLGRQTPEYMEHPTAFWLIRLMDLGFVIPLGLLTGVGLLRRTAAATRVAYAFTGTQALLACAVAGMAIRMWIRDDPAVTLPLLLMSTIGAAVFATMYVFLLRAGLPHPSPSTRQESRTLTGTIHERVTS